MGGYHTMTHRLLAHSTELIRDCTDGFCLKELSEKAVESCNKLNRKYREHLGRKNSFSLNTRDKFVRILSQSNPVLTKFRHYSGYTIYIPCMVCVICKTCGELRHICKLTRRLRLLKMNKSACLIFYLYS